MYTDKPNVGVVVPHRGQNSGRSQEVNWLQNLGFVLRRLEEKCSVGKFIWLKACPTSLRERERERERVIIIVDDIPVAMLRR